MQIIQSTIENQKDLGSNYYSVLYWVQQKVFKTYSKNTPYVYVYLNFKAAGERVHTLTFLAYHLFEEIMHTKMHYFQIHTTNY